jgi:hypothetical protein
MTEVAPARATTLKHASICWADRIEKADAITVNGEAQNCQFTFDLSPTIASFG